MDNKPFSLEGLIYTRLSNTGDILDNLSPISAWPSYNGTGVFAPSVTENQKDQYQQQHSAVGFMASSQYEPQVHPFDPIYTSGNSPALVFDTNNASSASPSTSPSLNIFNNRNDIFTGFNSSYHTIDNILETNNNNNVQDNLDYHSLFDNDTTEISNNNNDMGLLTATYFTNNAAAALNANNLSPFSMHHPRLTMSRSSSLTSTVSYIDPSVLSQNNNHSNGSGGGSGSVVSSCYSTPQVRRFSTFSNGGFESSSDDENCGSMRSMFENNLRMSSPAFGSSFTTAAATNATAMGRFESGQALSLSPSPSLPLASNVFTPEITVLEAPTIAQDIVLADGSVLRFDGTSFRPVPTTTTSTTTTTMNNVHISGMSTMNHQQHHHHRRSSSSLKSGPVFSGSGASFDEATLSMLMNTPQQMSTAHAATNTAYNSTMNLVPNNSSGNYRLRKSPSVNESFKRYSTRSYHKNSLASKSTTSLPAMADSSLFAAALLAPYSTRRGSVDSNYSTGSWSSRPSGLVADSHSRNNSTASFDFDDQFKRSSVSSTSPSSSSSSSSSPPLTLSSSSLSPSNRYRKDGAGQYQCPYEGCTYRYNLKRELNRHRNVHVFAGKDKYRCLNCNSGLCRLDSVKRHMEAKGKADCLKKGLYQEFHENGNLSRIRKCKQSWYDAAAAAAAARASKRKTNL
ncbi:hypothetical protein BGX29_005730 [Mortierella sp. GBA35]|nr:hypothetical protein BGX29_005730 [Mortierella sp. GBA35]